MSSEYQLLLFSGLLCLLSVHASPGNVTAAAASEFTRKLNSGCLIMLADKNVLSVEMLHTEVELIEGSDVSICVIPDRRVQFPLTLEMQLRFITAGYIV